MKLRLAHNPITRTRMHLFKRHAPNDMKKEDLLVKRWIITDRQLALMGLREETDAGESVRVPNPIHGEARTAPYPVF
jgi:hypothetical protein